MREGTLFDMEPETIDGIVTPDTYKGLYSFHKYWGKKPPESLIYFIEKYTSETDIIMDPFMGSGFIVREGLKRNRRVVGIDINPFSIDHTTFLIDLPSAKEYQEALQAITEKVKKSINESYMTESRIAGSHYLWDGNDLRQVWLRLENKRTRTEKLPSDYDRTLYKSFSNYIVRNIREPLFFTNSRINSRDSMTISDIFTKRALRNMDLLLDEIKTYSGSLQRALYLTLTSASGQMSSMVFAITGRGKTKNKISEKIEVGSWVIGFWKPELHFEINVWNCFESRAKKLHSILQEVKKDKYVIHNNVTQLFNSTSGCFLKKGDCLEVIKTIPDNSVQLVCTDPPHSDRIPYLELSEMWNAILNKEVSFEKEIVVSNAKARNKTKEKYIKDMSNFIVEVNRILSNEGVFLLYYNARDKESWKFMEMVEKTTNFEFFGAFPLEYSANSVVQDNRKGGLKTDYALIMKRKGVNILNVNEFNHIPGWLTSLSQVAVTY